MVQVSKFKVMFKMDEKRQKLRAGSRRRGMFEKMRGEACTDATHKQVMPLNK